MQESSNFGKLPEIRALEKEARRLEKEGKDGSKYREQAEKLRADNRLGEEMPGNYLDY